jgi:hypothetical protein
MTCDQDFKEDRERDCVIYRGILKCPLKIAFKKIYLYYFTWGKNFIFLLEKYGFDICKGFYFFVKNLSLNCQISTTGSSR